MRALFLPILWECVFWWNKTWRHIWRIKPYPQDCETLTKSCGSVGAVLNKGMGKVSYFWKQFRTLSIIRFENDLWAVAGLSNPLVENVLNWLQKLVVYFSKWQYFCIVDCAAKVGQARLKSTQQSPPCTVFLAPDGISVNHGIDPLKPHSDILLTPNLIEGSRSTAAHSSAEWTIKKKKCHNGNASD